MATFRMGVPGDVPVLVEYWHAMLVECGLQGSGFVPDWRERLAATFEADLAMESGVWFVAEAGAGGAITGTCALFFQTGRSNISLDITAMLAGMYVPPEFRGKGIARGLLERAIAYCRERGVKTIRLNASAMGRPLYESAGFVAATEMMRLTLR